MRTAALISLLVVVLLGIITTGCTQSHQDEDHYWQQVNLRQAQEKQRLDERLLASKTEHVRLTLGEAAASTYNLCHKYPPTTESHKAKCKRIDDQFAKIEAEEKKHPW